VRRLDAGVDNHVHILANNIGSHDLFFGIKSRDLLIKQII
jgi:hypothetical protein